MRANVFFTDAGVFVVGTGRTRRGALTDDEPVLALPIGVDASTLGAAVITALEAHHEPLDDDALAAKFDERIRQATPYRTLAALERGARSEVVDRVGNQITIYPTAFTRGQGFIFEVGAIQTIVEPFAVGSAMLNILSSCKNVTIKPLDTERAPDRTGRVSPRGSSLMVVSTPIPFGFKSAWFAVRSDNPALIAATIELQGGIPALWDALVPTAPVDRVFISPAVEGWVFLLGDILPAAGGPRWIGLLHQLSSHSGEAQYFATHRVSDYQAWGRARDGVVTRGFASAGLAVLYDVGVVSPEEVRVRERHPTIDESFVMELAARWSLDPSQLDAYTSVGTGLIGSI